MKRPQYNAAILALGRPSEKNALTHVGDSLLKVGSIINDNQDRRSRTDLLDEQTAGAKVSNLMKEKELDSYDTRINSQQAQIDSAIKRNESQTQAADIKTQQDKRKEELDAQNRSVFAMLDDYGNKNQFIGNITQDQFDAFVPKIMQEKVAIDNPSATRMWLDKVQGRLDERYALERKSEPKAGKDDKEYRLNEADLPKFRANFKEAFDEEPTAADEERFKKGDPKYTDWKTFKDSATKRKIRASVSIEEAFKELDKYDLEDIESVAGRFQYAPERFKRDLLSVDPDDWAITSGIKETFGGYTQKEQDLMKVMMKLNSEEMHRLYGAALTGSESGRAKQWSLDLAQSASGWVSSADALRRENLKGLKDTKQGYINFPVQNFEFRSLSDVYRNKADESSVPSSPPPESTPTQEIAKMNAQDQAALLDEKIKAMGL